MFAIERFSEAEHLRARDFEIPASFNVRHALHGAFGPHIGDPDTKHDVVVELAREKALLVAPRTWHPSQRIEVTRAPDEPVAC